MELKKLWDNIIPSEHFGEQARKRIKLKYRLMGDGGFNPLLISDKWELVNVTIPEGIINNKDIDFDKIDKIDIPNNFDLYLWIHSNNVIHIPMHKAEDDKWIASTAMCIMGSSIRKLDFENSISYKICKK